MIIDDARKRELRKKMMGASNLLENKQSRAKICLYGDNGTGKTTTAVAMARKLIGPDKKIVFVDTNEGYESLRNIPGLAKNIELVKFESAEQLYVLAELIHEGAAPYDNIGAIVFDDMDFMAAADLNRLWHDRVAKGKSTLDPDKPERPEYLKLGFLYTDTLEHIYNKTPDIHVFITTHAKEKKTKDGDTVLKIFPGFNPALANEIMGRLLVLGHMTAKEIKGGEKNAARYERSIQVHPTYLIDAKSRIGCEKIRYEVMEFIAHVADWSKSGRGAENEAAAIKRDLKTSKVMTVEDELAAATTLVDDDSPVIVQ